VTNLLALAVATAFLVLIPGPNVALIVATSLRYGVRLGVATVFGTTLGVALQLLAVVAGMAAILEFAAESLNWIRWAGVAYLIWLGVRTWRQPVEEPRRVDVTRKMIGRGVLIAAINPKTLMFNAAFLPQFVAADGNPLLQLGLVASVFLAVLFIGDLLWAIMASSARPLLARVGTVQNRLAGGFLVAAGIGLALARRNA
jgi:threonine/homoserine/homoserine lactone efflux protein